MSDDADISDLEVRLRRGKELQQYLTACLRQALDDLGMTQVQIVDNGELNGWHAYCGFSCCDESDFVALFTRAIKKILLQAGNFEVIAFFDPVAALGLYVEPRYMSVKTSRRILSGYEWVWCT